MANSNSKTTSSVSVAAAVAALVGNGKVRAELKDGKLFVAVALDVESDLASVKSRAGQVWLKEAAMPHTDVGNGLEAHCLKVSLVHVKNSDGTFFVQKRDTHATAVERAFKSTFKTKKGEALPPIEKMEAVLKVLGISIEE